MDCSCGCLEDTGIILESVSSSIKQSFLIYAFNLLCQVFFWLNDINQNRAFAHDHIIRVHSCHTYYT